MTKEGKVARDEGAGGGRALQGCPATLHAGPRVPDSRSVCPLYIMTRPYVLIILGYVIIKDGQR